MPPHLLQDELRRIVFCELKTPTRLEKNNKLSSHESTGLGQKRLARMHQLHFDTSMTAQRGRWTRAAELCLFGALLSALISCGGGSNQAPSQTMASLISDGGGETVTGSGTESGAPTKILSIPGSATALVALFPDGRTFYSADGYNMGGGGSTVAAYSGDLKVVDIELAGTGIDTLFSDGTVFFSPDGTNLGGGGSTVHAYTGTAQIAGLTPVGGGVDALFADGRVYFSPDGLNLGGGGSSVSIYSGTRTILQIVPVGAGVVTRVQGGPVYVSPDNRDIGGGGTTVSATPGTASTVTTLVQVGGGVLAEFSNGDVYLSPDGQNLAGGGATVRVSAWDTSVANGPFGERDSAHGTQFAGHFWLSGGFDDPGGTDCTSTCSYFDLWSSTDLTGTSWNSTPSFATATSPDPRDVNAAADSGEPANPTDFYDSYSAIVAWNSRLFAIGSTVWSSADGTHWARQNLADGVTAAPGPIIPIDRIATENSRAMQLGTALFFLQPDTAGQVYSTTDPNAVSWNDLGPIPGFPLRCGATAFVLLGKLWIEGGGKCDYSKPYHDIWSSPDGITWTQNPAPAAWSARMWGCIAPGDDGIIWMVGGYAPTDWTESDGNVTVRYAANHSDVWYTKDGIDWKQFKADYGSGLRDGNALEPRHAATCYVANGSTAGTKSLVVIGGSAGSIPTADSEHVSNTIRVLPLPATSALP
jgi:hypothetical protein